jgi:hypothetical protein
MTHHIQGRIKNRYTNNKNEETKKRRDHRIGKCDNFNPSHSFFFFFSFFLLALLEKKAKMQKEKE